MKNPIKTSVVLDRLLDQLFVNFTNPFSDIIGYLSPDFCQYDQEINITIKKLI